MATSTVRRDAVLDDISGYSHAVVAFTDERGYPVSFAADFQIDEPAGVVRFDLPAPPITVPDGIEINVTFSHIRPYPGVGYDQRRYVSLWGRVAVSHGALELRPERTHGWDEQRMSFFELCEPVKTQMSLGWLIFLATRVPFLTATIVPVLLGAVVARVHGFSAWWAAMLALLGASAIHLGLNVANDVSDTTSGADEVNVNPTMFSGGSRVIQYGLVSLQTMRMVSIACYAVGIGIGLYFVATRGIELLWIGLAGIFLSIFYTAPPLRLVHRGLGEVCVALGFGPIMVLGSYFVVAERLSGEALYASLPVGLLIMLVLYVNQVPDRPADERAGKRTIVVRLGKEAIVSGYAFFVTTAFVLIAVGALAGLMPIWTLVALAPAPLAFKVYQALRSHYESPYELMDAMGKNIMLHLFTGLLLIAGYVIEIAA
jgi:1,4-dihydroxy-2-naphthoate octaprenyltransferase